MRPHKALAAATCGLVLCLATTWQSRATVIVESGTRAANPAVETGGHRLPPGQLRPATGAVMSLPAIGLTAPAVGIITPLPAVDMILLDTAWPAAFGTCPWELSGPPSLLRRHARTTAGWPFLRAGRLRRPVRPPR
jgi:hypothetical protein